MAISSSKYVDITSGVIGAPAVPGRQFIQRIFTTNTLAPVNEQLQFSTLAAVGDFFGTTSQEFQRAVGYFGFISPSLTQPVLISYAGYSLVAVPSLINGGVKEQFLGDLQTFNTAVIDLTIGATNAITAPFDLSVATSIADAMLIMETAIRASSAPPEFASCVVTYDAIAQRVIFTTGATGLNPITVTSPTTGCDAPGRVPWRMGTTSKL